MGGILFIYNTRREMRTLIVKHDVGEKVYFLGVNKIEYRSIDQINVVCDGPKFHKVYYNFERPSRDKHMVSSWEYSKIENEVFVTKEELLKTL